MSSLKEQMILRDKEMVPRFLVQAMFALMITVTALVAFAQWTGLPNTGVVTEAPIVKERVVTIAGDRRGIYTLTENGVEIAVSSDDRAGFIGVIGKVIDRQRMLSGVPFDTPLRIVRRDNGHTAIIDDGTGHTIELSAYGTDNIASFANLLD